MLWIISDDHSRVKLEYLPDDPHSDYINADYIDVSTDISVMVLAVSCYLLS